jgi:hypothetical protein
LADFSEIIRRFRLFAWISFTSKVI